MYFFFLFLQNDNFLNTALIFTFIGTGFPVAIEVVTQQYFEMSQRKIQKNYSEKIKNNKRVFATAPLPWVGYFFCLSIRLRLLDWTITAYWELR